MRFRRLRPQIDVDIKVEVYFMLIFDTISVTFTFKFKNYIIYLKLFELEIQTCFKYFPRIFSILDNKHKIIS